LYHRHGIQHGHFYRRKEGWLKKVLIPTINEFHTWNNRRGGKHRIAWKLDKLLLFENLVERYFFIEDSILPSVSSDHWHVYIELYIKEIPKNKSFKFESF